MKVHSLLQKLANKLKTVKPLIKKAQSIPLGAETGLHDLGRNIMNGDPAYTPPHPSEQGQPSHAFYIINDTRYEEPYIRNMPDAALNNRDYRPILLENGIVLLVSKHPDADGNYKVFTYNDMGELMPDVNSDEMKVLSRLGTAVYSGLSNKNAPVEDLLTGQSISLGLVPLGHIPVVIPNSHTGGLLDRGTEGINNNTLYLSLERNGAVQLGADRIYTKGGVGVNKDYHSGEGLVWGEDAPVGTLMQSVHGDNPRDPRGKHPMGDVISHLFNLASPQYDPNLLTDEELQHIDTLLTQEAKDSARLAFILLHNDDREAAISLLRLYGYDSELGYIPGLTNRSPLIPNSAYDIQQLYLTGPESALGSPGARGETMLAISYPVDIETGRIDTDHGTYEFYLPNGGVVSFTPAPNPMDPNAERYRIEVDPSKTVSTYTSRGGTTLYDTPNMIGRFIPHTMDSINTLQLVGGVSMQNTDPHILNVNRALLNDEAALQAFQQLEATYPDFENVRYDPGDLQGDAKILYNLFFYNRLLIDGNAKTLSFMNSNSMLPEGVAHPEAYDWRQIPVLSSYEGFKSANLNEVNENTHEDLDLFTRFAIASLAHKRYRGDRDSRLDGAPYSITPPDGLSLNMVSSLGLVHDGTNAYNAATHRANHLWYDLRQDYLQYARLAELMRLAMEYAVPLDPDVNTTFTVHGGDYDNLKANSHLAPKIVQQLHPNEDILNFRMDQSDNFMSHPMMLRGYNSLYNSIIGAPARAFNAMSRGMMHAGDYVQDADIPIISPVIGGGLLLTSYVPGLVGGLLDVPGHILSAGDIINGGISKHWTNAQDLGLIPTMLTILGRSYSGQPLYTLNPVAADLAYRNASIAAGRNMVENPEARGGAEYVMSGLEALAVGTMGLRGLAAGAGNVARLLGKTRMSNLVNNAIHNNVDDLVLNMGNGVIKYGDDALETATQKGTLNNLTLRDDAILRAANIGQLPKYIQAFTSRYPWLNTVVKPIDWGLGFTGLPRMNFTREGLRLWRDLILHARYTGQTIPFRASHLINPVNPFYDGAIYQRTGIFDENGDFVTISQPTGFDITMGLSRDITGLNDMEGVFNQIHNGLTYTEDLYNTVGQGYAPGGSLVYKPYGNAYGIAVTPNGYVENSPWFPGTGTNIYNLPLYTSLTPSGYHIFDSNSTMPYRPDQDSLDTQVYDLDWFNYNTDLIPVLNYPNYIPDLELIYDYPVHDYGSSIYDSGTIYNYNPSQTSTPGYVLPSQIPGLIPTYDNNSPIWSYGAPTSDLSYDTLNGRLELINLNGRMELRYSGNSENTTDSGSNLPSGTSSGTSSGQSGQYKPDTDTLDDYSRFDYN